MSKTRARSQVVARRAELLAELFLQDFEPEYLARPTTDFAYDLLGGFRNARGGINNIAVEVRSTERSPGARFAVRREHYERWANSNIPVLLLVVDVKDNQVYYHWPSVSALASSDRSQEISIPLVEADSKAKEDLRRRLAG